MTFKLYLDLPVSKVKHMFDDRDEVFNEVVIFFNKEHRALEILHHTHMVKHVIDLTTNGEKTAQS